MDDFAVDLDKVLDDFELSEGKFHDHINVLRKKTALWTILCQKIDPSN